MKKNRVKHAKKLVAIYKRMFNYHAPFLVLVDGTFCKAAGSQGMFDLRDRISNYLNVESTCCTTVCILNELKNLEKETEGTEHAESFKRARLIAKKFQVRHCEHKKNPVSGIECIKSMVSGDGSGGKYFVATKDKKIQSYCDKTPGIPVIYMHGNVILLKDLSDETNKKVITLNKEMWAQTADQESLKATRNTHEGGDSRIKRKRKRKAKGPNPLSCKKKKKKTD